MVDSKKNEKKGFAGLNHLVSDVEPVTSASVPKPTSEPERTPHSEASQTASQPYSGPLTFLKKHFNGDYSLARSYWVNMLLISMFAPLLGILMLPWLSENFPARYSSAGVLLMTALGVVAWTWALNGTWSSANKHVGRGGKQFWANAAKVMIVMGMLKTTLEITNMSGTLGEHWKIALGGQLGPAVSFQVRADGKSIMLKGGINDDASEALTKALDLAPSVITVVLDSTGGWVREANLIAKLISDRKLNTYVERECTSACTIAFLAGKERAADPNARIGFHSFRSVGSTDKDGESFDTETVKKMYRQAGISQTFIDKIVGVSNDKVWYPSHEEMLAEGVFTRTSIGGETATIATSALTREKLAAEFKKLPPFDALSLKYPNEFEKVVDKAWAKVEARKSDAEVMTASREQIGLLMSKLLPIAADASLLDFYRLMLDQAEALSRRSTAACVELMFPTGKQMNMAAFLPPELAARELALLSDLIRSSDARNAEKVSEQGSERVIMKVLGSLTQDQVQMLASEERRATSSSAACEAVVAYLRELNAIPETARARSLRAIHATN